MERNTVYRRLLRELLATDFDDNGDKAARALGVSRSAINQLKNGHKGAGVKILEGLTRYLRRSDEEILASAGDLVALRSATPLPASSRVEVVFRELPGWPTLLEGARALDPSLPEWVWRYVADARVGLRVPITASLVADLARFFLRHVPPDQH
ncbi:MAG TPA: helix-turn-helix transcriptional regulator [Gemmatimonadaceae bacterium]|nr:helix-turn-helix transcriptional regulator [Gemmatimonadaceae bacterium]